MAGIIVTSDLASYLRDSTVSGNDADFVVDLANGIVGDVIGTLDPIPTRVRAITLEIAARAWRNPNGYSSETIEDYTYRRDAETRQAGVYLTPSESAELLSITGKGKGTFYTVSLVNPLDVA